MQFGKARLKNETRVTHDIFMPHMGDTDVCGPAGGVSGSPDTFGS